MFKKDKTAGDGFTLGLGGINVITSFAPATAIAHHRLRQDRAGPARDIPQRKWRLWMPRRFRVA
jgi:hypothetical protein